MKLPFDLIIFDLECCQPSQAIFEIGAVKLKRDFTISNDGFSKFCNPGEPITKDMIELCNLDANTLTQIYNAPPLWVIVKDMYDWATKETKNVCLASWGNFDISELHRQDPTCPFRRKALDIKSIAQWEMCRYGIKATNSLAASCNAFDVKIIKPQHRALNDALTTAHLLRKLYQKHYAMRLNLDFLTNSLA